VGGLARRRPHARRRPDRRAEGRRHQPLRRQSLQHCDENLRENGLDGVNNQERYRALLILENLAEIETWRAGLDDAQRRRLNHPGAVWHAWRRRQQDSSRSAPAACNFVKSSTPVHKTGRAVHWPQACVRRAHEAMLKSRSSDLLTLARVAPEAGIPTGDVLADLLNDAKPSPQAKVSAPVHAVA
jgi:hypothetical protein